MKFSISFFGNNFRNARAELFSLFVINENFKFLTYQQQNILKVDREKSGYTVINQVKENKDTLSHHIKEFHSLKSVLRLKRKVREELYLSLECKDFDQTDFGLLAQNKKKK